MAIMTSSDILKINNSEELAGMVDEVISSCPELQFFAASPITKNSYKTLAITGHPSVSFRVPGSDRTYSTGTLENKTVDLKYLDASWKLEKAVAAQSDWGENVAIALQQKIHLDAAFNALAKQIWYGNSTVDGGFNGLYLAVSALGDEKNITCNSGSTFTDGSSVFLVSTGMEAIQLAWGNGGKFTEGPIESQECGTASAGRWFWVQELASWVGMQITSKHACVKISGLSATGSLTGLNDNLLYQALEKFPSGKAPGGIFMNRRSLGQLRKSRTATNATGAPAPLPTEFEGIPIYTTDAITNTEDYDTLSGSGSGSGSGGSGSGGSGSGT